MLIDWKKYVDHIYIVNYTGTDKYYLNHFYDELIRVNIDIHNVEFVTDFMNISTPIYNVLYDKFIKNKKKHNYTFDCSMGHYYCMKHAEQNNYDKILILENDAIFYDDINEIINILDNMNTLFENDSCDLFLGGSGVTYINSPKIDYDNHSIFKIRHNELNKYFCAGTTFNVYNHNSRQAYIDLIENGIYHVIDEYNIIYNMDRVCISNIPICLQKCWDLLIYDTYSHYNMIQPLEKDILNAYNACNHIVWADKRNLWEILKQAIEHYQINDNKYVNLIYEDCKKHCENK